MNHLFDIFDTLEQLPPNSEAVLATVVSVEGSAYRQPGARMLILADGQSIGMVSGGCLEKHLVQRAFWLTRDGATLKTYHTATDSQLSQDEVADDSDEQEGFGLGCQGVIQVLFERLVLNEQSVLFACFQRLKQTKQPQILATVITSNSDDFVVGQHLPLTQLSQLGQQDWQLVNQSAASRKSRFMLHVYQKQSQQLSVFVETLQPPLQLLIFGAGQDCLPLMTMANLQGWQVTVIDSRLDAIARCRGQAHANFVQIALDEAESVQTFFESPQPTAVVIMTHSLSQDRVWLSQAFKAQNSPFFIGQLGPTYRTEQLLGEIDDGYQLVKSANLFYPVGLALGGDTPEAVALSITAQIQQVYHERHS
ncbi:XdhC family protein [Moraxella osloensis]|nr:XdhC family protein [Moraxella osloensis]QQU06520.1 XdhC family protein [Moraxella osloensis]